MFYVTFIIMNMIKNKNNSIYIFYLKYRSLKSIILWAMKMHYIYIIVIHFLKLNNCINYTSITFLMIFPTEWKVVKGGIRSQNLRLKLTLLELPFDLIQLSFLRDNPADKIYSDKLLAMTSDLSSETSQQNNLHLKEFNINVGCVITTRMTSLRHVFRQSLNRHLECEWEIWDRRGNIPNYNQGKRRE